MNQFKKGFGLKVIPPRPEDAQFGKIFQGEAQPKDWRPYLPKGENQLNSMFCTNFACMNCLETITNYQKFLEPDKEQFNFSDRWNAVNSGTTPNGGNTLQNACHASHKEGNVLEEECPFPPEWLENSLTYWHDIVDISKIAPKQVYSGPNYSLVSPNDLKRALAYSPLEIGVNVGSNWYSPIVTPPTEIFGGHAVELAWIDEEGYYYIFDTAEPFIKKLSPDYPILIAMSFAPLPENWKSLNVRDIPTIQQKIINLAKQVIGLLKELIMKKQENKIEKMVLAMQKREGWITPEMKNPNYPKGSRSYRNNNPLNFKYSSYISSLGAYSCDKDNFAIFRDYQSGIKAGIQFIKDVCNRQVIPYHVFNPKNLYHKILLPNGKKGDELPNISILDFFHIYAPKEDNNDPVSYANEVAKKIEVIPSFLMKNLV